MIYIIGVLLIVIGVLVLLLIEKKKEQNILESIHNRSIMEYNRKIRFSELDEKTHPYLTSIHEGESKEEAQERWKREFMTIGAN